MNIIKLPKNIFEDLMSWESDYKSDWEIDSGDITGCAVEEEILKNKLKSKVINDNTVKNIIEINENILKEFNIDTNQPISIQYKQTINKLVNHIEDNVGDLGDFYESYEYESERSR